jgi:hypothetical protein
MHPNIALLIAVISKNPAVQFAKFLYETVESGEVAELLVLLGASTESLYKKDVEVLTQMLKTLKGPEKMAAQELYDSRMESLTYGIGTNDKYTQKNIWVYPQGLEKYGIRFHKDTGHFQITCLFQEKLVHIPGHYKTVNSRPFTILKNNIKRQLPSNAFRTYRLDHVAGIRANGSILEFDNVISRTV